MDINAKYKDLWQNKENTYREISTGMPIVIFMDGKSVTNNHKGFPMLGKENYTECLMKCGRELIKEINTDAILYAGLDELSVIFLEPEDVVRYFMVGENANYICTIFMQKFVKKFWNYYNSYFKNTIYNLKKEDVERYIRYRREICYSGGLWCIAKEYLPKEKYKGLDFDEMISLLKEYDLWDAFNSNSYIHEGYEYRHQKNEYSILDLITL